MKKYLLVITLFGGAFLPTSCANDSERIVVTFHGDGCTVTGNTELYPGEHAILIVDTSDTQPSFILDYLDDGYSFQDLADLQSYPDEYISQPHFAHHAHFLGSEEDETSGGLLSTYAFDNPGEYATLFYQLNPGKVWLCGPIHVLEPFSE